ncbi:YegP family protein [Methylobacterium sp. JK268]
MRFELYRDAGGHWRWRLRAVNGAVVADSAEGYVRREDCEHGIALVKGAAQAAIVDMTLKIA